MCLEAVFTNLIDFFENFWSGNFNKSGGQFFWGGAESDDSVSSSEVENGIKDAISPASCNCLVALHDGRPVSGQSDLTLRVWC